MRVTLPIPLLLLAGTAWPEDDPKAILKAAWNARYRMPETLIIEGEFRRRPEGEAPASILDDLQGRFVLDGDTASATLDGKRYASKPESWRSYYEETVVRQLEWILRTVRPRTFDTEFHGCSFALPERKEANPGEEVVVQVNAHPTFTAFRVRDRHIVGHEARKVWWTWKIRSTEFGDVVEKMSARIAGRDVVQEINYVVKKDLRYPNGFCMLLTDVTGDNGGPVLVRYDLRQLRVREP